LSDVGNFQNLWKARKGHRHIRANLGKNPEKHRFSAIFTSPNVLLKAVKNAVVADLMVTFSARNKAETAIVKLVDNYAF
jgi:ribosomal protein L18